MRYRQNAMHSVSTCWESAYWFWSGYNRVGKKFKGEIEKLKDLLANRKLFICGHSLGGTGIN